MQSLYDRTQVEWMWKELEGVGVKPMATPKQVDEVMAHKDGTMLLVVNSICGCAAGCARPGAAMALQNKVIPDRLTTVFAGVDREAAERARSYIKDMPPSSPSMALFKEGELVYFMPRSEIEGFTNDQVAAKLVKAFNEHCQRPGPSVTLEQLKKAFRIDDRKISHK